METLFHSLFQHLTGGISGTMTGPVTICILHQLRSQICQCRSIRHRIAMHQMETAHQYIRTEMSRYVKNTAVRAAGDENSFPVFLQQQVLLMPEIFREALFSHHRSHSPVIDRITRGNLRSPHQLQPRSERKNG